MNKPLRWRPWQFSLRTLMTLMLAGVMRGQAVPPAESYQAPIDRVLATHPAVTSAVTPVGKTADGGAGA